MYRQRNDLFKWLLILVGVGVVGWFYWQNQQQEDTGIWFEMAEESKEHDAKYLVEEKKIGVHAAGAVKKPGVYYLSGDARVVDLLRVAGGVLGTADLDQVNLAAPLVDGQKVVVPEKETRMSGGLSSKESSGGSSSGSGKISINNGTKEELMKLPGIGQSKAEAIILFREEQGYFRKLEDLRNVQGIGDKTFDRLKSQITLF